MFLTSSTTTILLLKADDSMLNALSLLSSKEEVGSWPKKPYQTPSNSASHRKASSVSEGLAASSRPLSNLNIDNEEDGALARWRCPLLRRAASDMARTESNLFHHDAP